MYVYALRHWLTMSILILMLAAAATANPCGVAFAEGATGSDDHHPPLLDCTPAPAPSADNDSAFRANMAAALAALPSAAAAAPTRSATVRFGAPGPGSAFARGLCFGAAKAGDCLACLSAAARDVTRGCRSGASSRRAGVWRAACFLAYADTDATSARENAFRGWFYAGPDTPAALGDGECTGGRNAAHCARCLKGSQRAAASASVGWLPLLRGDEVVVVGYSCILRVHVVVAPKGQPVVDSVWLWLMVELEAAVIALTFGVIILELQDLP